MLLPTHNVWSINISETCVKDLRKCSIVATKYGIEWTNKFVLVQAYPTPSLAVPVGGAQPWPCQFWQFQNVNTIRTDISFGYWLTYV